MKNKKAKKEYERFKVDIELEQLINVIPLNKKGVAI